MRKDEFLRLLRQALTGNVPAAVLEENVRYYDFYIREEVERRVQVGGRMRIQMNDF